MKMEQNKPTNIKNPECLAKIEAKEEIALANAKV